MWNIEELTGYHPISTFYEDFSIADAFGLDAIKDTYERACKEWKHDYKMITELVMVLNHRCWLHYEHDRIEMSKLYCKLYYELDDFCLNNLKGSELEYYIKTTD